VFKGCSAANVAEYYDKTECVRDNATGLIWQGQTDDSNDLRYGQRGFTNYYSTNGNQYATDPGFNSTHNVIPATQAQIDAITNSVGFKNAVNASNLCSINSWRIPSKEEFLSLPNTGSSPAFDVLWFPNARSFATNNDFYWTSSPDDLAWSRYYVMNYIYTMSGRYAGLGDRSSYHLGQRWGGRLVR
jgi:Protein of unknown function (DUF1566)